jgi:hypothetical protein
MINFGGPKISRIDADERSLGLAANAAFIGAGALPLNVDPDFCKSQLNEFTHGVAFSRCQHVRLGVIAEESATFPRHNRARVPNPAARRDCPDKGSLASLNESQPLPE